MSTIVVQFLLERIPISAVALALSFLASPQLEKNWQECTGSDPDAGIEACTIIIQSGDETGATLAAAFYNRGIARRAKGRYDLAVQDYDQAIRLKPDLAEAYNNRGIAHDATGHFDRAVEDYDRAIRLRPRYAEAFYNRAIAYQRKSQFERANREVRKAAPASRSSADRAIEDYGQAIALKPDFAEAYSNRGIVNYDMGQFDRAIQDYDQAIRLKPDLAEAYNNRSLAWYKKAQYDHATRDFDQTIRLNKNYGNALINRALGPAEAPVRRPST